MNDLNYKVSNAIQPVTAFPEPGVYDAPHMITLLCATQGAEIHYTLDGSTPTPASPIFDPHLLIPLEQFGQDVPEGKRTYTIRAIAVAGGQVSDVAVFQYDIEPRDRNTFVSQQLFPGVRLIRDFENSKMYLITGSERALLIDAGMSTGDLRGYVKAFTGDLALDVCITHGHPDHIAAMGPFQADCVVTMHHADLPLAQRFKEHLRYEIDLEKIEHIDEGFTFDLGDRQLTVYHIPGHSKGCLALLDETNGILFSGDAIGSNGPTIVDALWLQMSQDGVDEYLSALQVFRAKVAGKIKYICAGHGALYLEGEAYLDNLEEAAQQLVDHGVAVLVPSPRPAGAWKTVCGDRLTDPNWASINVNRETCLTAPPDQIASLSNLQVKGMDMNEPFKPGRLTYTINAASGTHGVEIIPTATSRRYSSLTVNGSAVKSGQAVKVPLNDKANVVSIEIIAPDGVTKNVYSLTRRRPDKAETISAKTASDPLLFPTDAYTVETKMVKTSAGAKRVTYHAYTHIPYVANPVDSDYQSLNVSVPIQVDGVAVDATNAPIFFAIGVGGYMSVNNARSGTGAPPRGDGSLSSKPDLALAAGYVVVSPGCRGRDNQAADGTYYGKAPAAIVDLKAAVRYIRHNKGVIPGNVDWIISSGCSAGGALSALLGASGNSDRYDAYLDEIGAADADDHVYASACFSPITDLEHADMAYEWMYGTTPTQSGRLVDQALSEQLKALFVEYQASLNLEGENGFGVITADNYDQYLLHDYLIPSANTYLQALTEDERNAYLAERQWIAWHGDSATFTFADYLAYTGRMKGLPAFDDFDMKTPEPSLFGSTTTKARHYTDFSLRQATGDERAEMDRDLQTVVNLMNPMVFIGQNNPGCALYWWLRHGTRDGHTSLTVLVNLTASLMSRNKDVNAWLDWDAGHCVGDDPEGLIAWVGGITGFSNYADVDATL